MYDTIVIGGGIVGASTAFHLASDGRETLLIDREDAGQATAAGAGIVSPPTTRHEGHSWYELAMASGKYYPDLVETIGELGIEETGFGQPGLLVIDLPGRDPGLYAAGRDRVFTRQKRYEFPSTDRLFEVSPGKASELFPPIAPVRNALYYADGGRVDGRVFRTALVRAGELVGLEVLTGSADRIVIEDDTVTAVIADGDRIATDNVVVAGGAWSDSFADQLGIRIPVSPQRGQIIHLDLGGTETAEWPIVNTFYEYYFVPWDDGRVAAGATRETGTGFAPNTTVAGVHEVLSETLDITPGLESAAIEEIRVGLRPASSDGAPIIGEVPAVRGAYIVTGHGPTGLTLGPYSGKIVSSLIQGKPVQVDVRPFAPDRFSA